MNGNEALFLAGVLVAFAMFGAFVMRADMASHRARSHA
jgi:hypothetical protein